MSKLTFRADEDLLERVERLDASKSKVMREALRTYLEDRDDVESGWSTDSLDRLVRERVDDLIEERVDRGPDVDLEVTLESPGLAAGVDRRSDEGGHLDEAGNDRIRQTVTPSETEADGERPDERCNQCGQQIEADHVYCPNCGEKRSRRVFCECGDELRSDWSFCPNCGRRTPAADVLEQS